VIYEKNLILEVEQGFLKQVVEVENSDHPAVPKNVETMGRVPVCLQIPRSADPHFQ
jgi:hypothetical protein